MDKSKTKSQNNLSSQSGDSKQPSLYNMSEFINFPGFNKYPGKKYPDVSQITDGRKNIVFFLLIYQFFAINILFINIKMNILGIS